MSHVIGLAGTRLPSYGPWDGSARRSAVARHGRHSEKKMWGTEQTRYSNMAAGVSILVSKKLWKPKHVVTVFDAPGRKMSLRW